MKYYAAYGSNLNKEQMRARCPESEVVGTAVIKDYELLFKRSGRPGSSRSCLTIEPKAGAYVPVGIWTLAEEDERELDRREGVSDCYYKKSMELEVTKEGGVKEKLSCLLYIKPERSVLDRPDPGYVRTCLTGYQSFGFDADLIHEAVAKSAL